MELPATTAGKGKGFFFEKKKNKKNKADARPCGAFSNRARGASDLFFNKEKKRKSPGQDVKAVLGAGHKRPLEAQEGPALHPLSIYLAVVHRQVCIRNLQAREKREWAGCCPCTQPLPLLVVPRERRGGETRRPSYIRSSGFNFF